ncbi:hypothetical protein [Oryzihumus leptocrescens]|uniref:hypothetical protein n=1 Tax=Oryzihumus leptocrescens TaxID=297536 RepID=UPI0011525D25|nr:hypothetical protein [Oryzihumus leptocrescens]
MNRHFAGAVPLFTGVLRGYRGWNVDGLGRLRPLVDQSKIWQPGLNIASCGVTHRFESTQVNFPKDRIFEPGASLGGGLVLGPLDRVGVFSVENGDFRTFFVDRWVPEEAHAVPKADCTCGFWAYFRGDSEYVHAGHVVGIIETQGRIICGSSGFRAQKARIVALVDPTMHWSWLPRRWHRSPVLREYSDVFAKLRTNYPSVRFYPSLSSAKRDFRVQAPPSSMV